MIGLLTKDVATPRGGKAMVSSFELKDDIVWTSVSVWKKFVDTVENLTP